MKITGAEWKEFEAHGWPSGWIWSDESVFDDETDLYGLDGLIRFADGEVFTVPSYWHAMPEDPPGDGIAIRTLIRRWRKARDTVTLAVTVPKTDLATAALLFGERGWKTEGLPT